MASNFTTAGQNTTVNFSWTAPTTAIQSIVGGCAELLCERQGINFSSLTNNEKLIVVENYLKQVILDLANSNKLIKAEHAARILEESNKYSL